MILYHGIDTVCDFRELQDDDSDGDDASEGENSEESEANRLKSPHGKRKASSFKSLPIQRPGKRSKSTYKMPLYEVRIDNLLFGRNPKSRGGIRRRNRKRTHLEGTPDSLVAPTPIALHSSWLILLDDGTENTITGI